MERERALQVSRGRERAGPLRGGDITALAEAGCGGDTNLVPWNRRCLPSSSPARERARLFVLGRSFSPQRAGARRCFSKGSC